MKLHVLWTAGVGTDCDNFYNQEFYVNNSIPNKWNLYRNGNYIGTFTTFRKVEKAVELIIKG